MERRLTTLDSNHVVGWAGIGLLFLLGCSIGGADRYVRTPPTESELVGVWRPDRATARLAREGAKFRGSADHFIDLRRDHSCTFSSSFVFPVGSLLTDHDCTWKLSTETAFVHHMERRVPGVELTLQKGSSTTFVSYYIVREHGRLVLWDYVGDPDADVYMNFVKRDE